MGESRVSVPLALDLPTPESTEACGAAFARCLPSLLQSPLLVYLEGDLGAGKTTWARGFLRELGLRDPVRSPTFTLLESYECGGIIALHLDLYRIDDPQELETLGLREWHRPGCVWLIEWPERGAGVLPAPDVRVRLEAGDGAHRLTARGVSGIGSQWVQAVTDLTSSKT